ncbi:MAG: DUF1957 domain-containing protein [Treponema sp.]|jgi:1,4-alpha-glucan branching enzyme|nr:DUF1957 domain-containing protein [Treponema sp.]
MSKKSLVIAISAHQPYIWHKEDDFLPQNGMLYSAISETYLPLLNMFSNLEADGIPFKLMMCFSPSLCALLSDSAVQGAYIEWLDKVIELGEAEIIRYAPDDMRRALAEEQLRQAKRDKYDFSETYQQDLLSKFSYYAKKGNIELMATAATNCYLPMYVDLPQAVQAQIEVGLMSHRHYFDTAPEGFWLPYMAYTPGLESIIRPYGFFYTILDAHGFLFGSPVPMKGIFSPARCFNSLAVFARDNAVAAGFEDNPELYYLKGEYRNQNRDIGFENPLEQLEGFLNKENARLSTGYKYWSNETDVIYNTAKALASASADADTFLDMKARKLAQVSEQLDNTDVSSVCCFEASFFGQKWYEGIAWLESVFRKAAERDDIELTQCSELLENKFSLQKITPFNSAASGTGYAEDLIDHSNDWMIRYVRKAVERMIDLTARFPSDSGLKERSLNLAAKEVLLAQSGDWPEMVKKQDFDLYASNRFRENVGAFTTVYDSLGSNSISTEWLTNMEREHKIFPWINYRAFSAKR